MNNIKNIRQMARKTQKEVAALLDIDTSTVAKWEAGKSLPRAELLPKLARLFNCTIDELLADDEKAS